MKKNYMKPEMEVVKIEMQQMLAASAPGISDTPFSSGDEVLAPELPFDLFED